MTVVSHFHDLLERCNKGRSSGLQIDVLDRMAKAPKFVFSDDVLHWLIEYEADYREALAAAVKAGHRELPHSPMVVEWHNMRDDNSARIFWWIKEVDSGASYELCIAWLLHDDTFVADKVFPARFDHTGLPIFHYPIEELRDTEQSRTVARNITWSGQAALAYAMALHVRGIITRPPPPFNPKLARARLKRGQPPITKDYVTVHIGYVTDRKGKRHDYQEGLGHHVRVHLRRGHHRIKPADPA